MLFLFITFTIIASYSINESGAQECLINPNICHYSDKVVVIKMEMEQCHEVQKLEIISDDQVEIKGPFILIHLVSKNRHYTFDVFLKYRTNQSESHHFQVSENEKNINIYDEKRNNNYSSYKSIKEKGCILKSWSLKQLINNIELSLAWKNCIDRNFFINTHKGTEVKKANRIIIPQDSGVVNLFKNLNHYQEKFITIHSNVSGKNKMEICLIGKGLECQELEIKSCRVQMKLVYYRNNVAVIKYNAKRCFHILELQANSTLHIESKGPFLLIRFTNITKNFKYSVIFNSSKDHTKLYHYEGEVQKDSPKMTICDGKTIPCKEIKKSLSYVPINETCAIKDWILSFYRQYIYLYLKWNCTNTSAIVKSEYGKKESMKEDNFLVLPQTGQIEFSQIISKNKEIHLETFVTIKSRDNKENVTEVCLIRDGLICRRTTHSKDHLSV